MTQPEFAKLDYQVMRLAYNSHNQLGRLCDETIYRNDLAARIEQENSGPVSTEIPVTVTHRDFTKTYRLDLIVGDASIYELKTATTLAPKHEAQLLNYLFLTEARHGKLINFRRPQIQSRFLNNHLTIERRRQFNPDMKSWREQCNADVLLRRTMLDLLADWGAFLDTGLYQEALIHLLGGESAVVRRISLQRDGIQLGTQQMTLIDPDTAFRVTALVDGWESLKRNSRPYSI